MKTIGEYLKDKRVKGNYTYKKIETDTKIKREFVVAIENENWHELPDYPVVLGFVKKIARSLRLSEKQAAALLRRDYPPKKLPINPKPDVSRGFKWSPKTTFIVGVGVVILAIFTYLGYQYALFTKPPLLEVYYPTEGESINESHLLVTGKTNKEATVIINNQPVLVTDDGDFEASLEVNNQTQEVVVQAKYRSGKETVVHRNIEVVIPKL